MTDQPSQPRASRTDELATFLRSLDLDPGHRDLAPVAEALSHTSARLGRNHEQLEFLGDAVLRLAAAEYLAAEHAALSVGRRSALRAQLVSDRWLAELGQRCGIERVWQVGPMAAGDRAGQATVRAELCEALIGAVYQLWGGPHGGLVAVQRWLTPHWRRTSAELLADPDRHNWKSALQEWSQGRGLGRPHYACCDQKAEGRAVHGDPRRFHCTATLPEAPQADGQSGPAVGEGWGPSRREAEQQAARQLLQALRPAPGC
jgi:ribonuclease-3